MTYIGLLFGSLIKGHEFKSARGPKVHGGLRTNRQFSSAWRGSDRTGLVKLTTFDINVRGARLFDAASRCSVWRLTVPPCEFATRRHGWWRYSEVSKVGGVLGVGRTATGTYPTVEQYFLNEHSFAERIMYMYYWVTEKVK